MTPAPSTYREADGLEVEMPEAKAVWVPIARDVLIATAARYNHTITSKDLAKELQERSGIRTRKLSHNWIGDVLGEVSAQCSSKGEPLLSALCVHQDGTLGTGYADAVAAAYGPDVSDDLDMQSAEERLRCYQHFGAVMPADGGRPRLTPQVATRRSTAARRAFEERKMPVCPTCHLQLPAAGRCDNCA